LEFFPDGAKGERSAGSAPLGEPPERLGGGALAEWLRIVPMLAGVATALDRAAVVAYCRAVAAAESSEAVLDTQGATYTTAAGKVLPRPEVRMAEQARRAALRWAAELGLTPASRARLGLPVAPPPSKPTPVERFFR
jgi:P27 family predicted phage terminase small subunit